MKRIPYVAIAITLVLVATAFTGVVSVSKQELSGPNGVIWKAIQDLQGQITSLTNTVSTYIANLQGQITGLGTRVTAVENKNTAQDAAVTAETNARTAADTDLQDQINANKIKIVTGVVGPGGKIVYLPEGYTFDQCQIFVSTYDETNPADRNDIPDGSPLERIVCYSVPYPDPSPVNPDPVHEGWIVDSYATYIVGEHTYTVPGYTNYMIIAQK